MNLFTFFDHTVKLSDPLLLLFLFLAVLFDLGVRWVAFGRVESVAIDVAVFSWLYTYVKMLEEFKTNAECCPWSMKVTLEFLVLGALVCLHLYFRRALTERIDEQFENLHENAHDDQKKFLRLAKKLAIWSIDVALWEKKPGKRKRREVLSSAINSQFNLQGENQMGHESFLYENKKKRTRMIWAFIFLGLVSLLIPVIEITKTSP